jgi:hypothetical protein
MESSNPSGRSYWDLLGDALRDLDAGDLPHAERNFDLALAERSQSPGRVFLTEKLADGLTSLIRGRGKSRPGSKARSADGRWSRKAGDFRRRFLAEGERVVRDAVRLAELRPEDDAETNQPILETALFLVGRSRLFSEEPSSAVPLLKGLFRTAGKTGRPFDAQLIRHDIPLTEEDRLWLARKGPEVLEEFVANGELEPGSPESGLWVQVILQLLNPRYFGSVGRLAEERAWLEAVTTDRLLKQPVESIDLYRAYLQVNPEPGVRPDEARIRLLELLANIEGIHFPVPRYAEALGVMQAAGLAAGSAASDRFQLALERIEYRRPDPEPGRESAAWASVGLEADGKVAVVFWWKNEPRDVAFWSTGDDPEAMVRYLEPCGDRIVATEPAVVEAVGTAWESPPAAWSVRDFACAFLEASLPESGLGDDTLLKIGLGESGPWRSGWKPDLGHPLLDPPRRSALLDTWRGGAASGALLGGLVWQAILARIESSDPALRAGIGAMAHRADPAADFLYDFLNLDQDVGQSIDSSFEPWTLPLLWTRPDPFGFAAQTGGGQAAAAEEADNQARPDLGHNDLAIVATGDPGAVLAAWGDGRRKWRVALDRLDRLADLARVAVKAIGPVTVIPAGGQVHSLRGCLDLLEHLLSRNGRPAGRVDGLLPLFHWLRLVETHNGDVLDFLQLRPRTRASIALFDRYQALVGDLELVEPVLEPSEDEDPWATQFSQRVRKAGLVAGLADGLTLDPLRLDSLWGVFEGSDVSWVFLDSAAIHWHLLARQGVGIQELHALLHTRGSRHLSMLVGAVWMRSELEDLLGTWLGVYGSPYCLALTNMHPPLLRLADRGVSPDAVHLSLEAHASGVAQVNESIELAGSGTVLLPARGSHRELWRRIADGEIGLGRKNWSYLDPGQESDTALPAQKSSGNGQLLLVPVLDSLADDAVPIAQQDTREAWVTADQDRASYLIWRRRLCGLEIAGLLAGPWETVEIMDCRWWRILEPRPADQASGTSWSGDRALTAAAVDGCRLFNLPQVGSGPGSTIHPNTLEAVRHWLAKFKQEVPSVAAADSALPAESRVVLALLEPEKIWESLVLPVARAWERGQLGSWLMLVSDWVPASAASVVAAGYSPGISVWAGDRPSQRPAPVLWCTAADLEDPELKTLLKDNPPASVLVLEVGSWLPSADRTGQHGATALRTLLDSPAGRLVLQTESLTGPWCSFLSREAKAVIVGEPSSGVELPGSEQGASLLPSQAVLPDAGQALSPEVIVRRMHRLLDNLKPALGLTEGQSPGGGDNGSPGRQLVALDRLSVLSGLPGQQIAAGFRLLRWVARLAGDSLSDAETGSAGNRQDEFGHTLLIPRRFAELEHLLTDLEEQIAVLFPLMLGDYRPGLPTWFDLEYPPVQLEPGQLDLIDCFLASLSRSSAQELGLIYQCPRGVINTTRRLVGATAPPAEVLGRVQKALQLFRSRLGDVMGSAVERGDGFLVETGLQQLRPDERDFLALGSALGLWSWSGPACPGALHVVDLLTTAGSATVRLGTSGWELLEQELELVRNAAAPDPEEVQPAGKTSAVEDRDRWHVGGLRSFFTGTGKTDELDLASDRVAALAAPGGDPGLLVLAGLAGTGRHQALTRGLQRARNQAGFSGEITIYCPDNASAAHFLQQGALTGEWHGSPEIRVVSSKQGLPRPNRNRQAGDPGSDAVVVMLEIHRFEAETRYQIAQLGRGRRLLMTTDPGASTEPWEHLFLTIPRASEVLRLETQRTVSRKVWSDIRMLLPEGLRGKEKSLATGKGNVNAVYAVNLDQCLARMVQEVESGTLPQRFRLVGPLTSDLDFLATSFRERGWLAVAENRLDAALLPGPREVLAAATLAAGQLGLLAGLLASDSPSLSEDGTGDDSEAPVRPELAAIEGILGHCLGPEARAALAPWKDSCRDLDPETTLGDFLADLEAWPWARSILADPRAAARAATLIQPWAGRSLADLESFALWEAWLYSSLDALNLTGLIRRRPLVTLTESGQFSGAPAAAGVYLCLGTELPRQHYNVLSRITDDLLILFKERSPLAAEAAD